MERARLFVYGSLAPRGANAHLLKRLNGRWDKAEARAEMVQICRGGDAAYPALKYGSQRVSGWCFSARLLALFWPELDRFEGPNYCRAPIQVRIKDCLVYADSYFLREWHKRPPIRTLGRRRLWGRL